MMTSLVVAIFLIVTLMFLLGWVLGRHKGEGIVQRKELEGAADATEKKQREAEIYSLPARDKSAILDRLREDSE